MRNPFLNLSRREQREIIIEVSVRAGIPPFYVEKDFWVCYVLHILFSNEPLKSGLVFRGGTSLSKAWHLINRFSEDIDLSFNATLIPVNDTPAESGLSVKEQRLRFQELRSFTRQKIREFVIPALTHTDWHLSDKLEHERDPFTVELLYPGHSFDIPGSYHRPVVKIECSGRAEGWPVEEKSITSFIAEQFPVLAPEMETRVLAVHPARTFLEKLALLHEQNNRPNAFEIPLGQSRHLFDVWMLSRSPEIQQYFEIERLMERVIAHRRAYFAYGWINYDTLNLGNLQICPDESNRPGWEHDYERMRPMFAGFAPAFEVLMADLEALESSFKQR